ncbi:MAG: Brp/Blh family beta-carotene 15,15'-dioxygenase [Candidatus Obscuribacterales bacterium]|nr:Brp/Blh family beta-carotene 15,15'-dioxygenase [Candidatus Obscuribacterales bacterium]
MSYTMRMVCHSLVSALLMVAISVSLYSGLICLSMQSQLALAMSLIATIGLAHGALDHIIDGKTLVSRFGLKSFLAAYLSLSLIVLVTWHFFPNFAIIAFLVMSGLHFGFADLSVSERPSDSRIWIALRAIFRGFVPIIFPCTFFPRECTEIFRCIGFTGSLETVSQVSLLFFFAWLLLGASISCGQLFFGRRSRRATTESAEDLETFSIMILSAISPPLISFSIYFSFSHAARQILRIMHSLDNESMGKGFMKFCFHAVPMLFVALLIGVLMICFFSCQASLSASETRTIFILLSSLTLPHMLLASRTLGDSRRTLLT